MKRYKPPFKVGDLVTFHGEKYSPVWVSDRWDIIRNKVLMVVKCDYNEDHLLGDYWYIQLLAGERMTTEYISRPGEWIRINFKPFEGKKETDAVSI